MAVDVQFVSDLATEF